MLLRGHIYCLRAAVVGEPIDWFAGLALPGNEKGILFGSSNSGSKDVLIEAGLHRSFSTPITWPSDVSLVTNRSTDNLTKFILYGSI